MGRTGRRVLAAVLVALALAPAGTTSSRPASAHASLISSEPAPGASVRALDRVVLTFADPVDVDGVHVWLENDDGLLPLGAATHADGDERTVVISVPPIASGTYTLGYHVLAADGDEVTGEVAFTLDRPPVAGAADESIAPPVTGVEPLPAVSSESDASAVSRSPAVPLVVRDLVLVALLGAGAFFAGRRIPLLRRPW